MRQLLLPAAICLAAAGPAHAADIFAGIYAHDARFPIADGIGERGADFQFGYRGAPIVALRRIWSPTPYVVASVNSTGDTSFAAAGLSWRFGGKAYLRPGLGLAVHTGPSRRYDRDGTRTDLGSRITFEPEVAAGFQLTPDFALEASWTHLSHAWLFSQQNPGLDMLGIRANFRLR